MIKIKVCGMTDPVNVGEISDFRPDYMGFIFYPESPRYIGDNPDMILFRSIPEGIVKTGVFVNEDIDVVCNIAGRAGLSLIQLHGSESPDYCSRIKSTGLKIMKAFGVTEDFDFNDMIDYLPFCDFLLFDTKTGGYGGSGRKFRWSKLDSYNLDKPFFLSGGIGPSDAGIICGMENERLFGVDINSRFEIAPGVKDASMTDSFIRQIRRGSEKVTGLSGPEI